MDKRFYVLVAISICVVLLFTQIYLMTQSKTPQDIPLKSTFSETDNKACFNTEGDVKVWFIGSSTCPYCQQTDRLLKGFLFYNNDTEISYYIDAKILPEDVVRNIQGYYDGHVPFLMIGCKYYRIGLAYTNETSENFTAYNTAEINGLINKLHT